MAQLETINTPQDYVNYTFNVEARGIAEVAGELMGLSNTVNSLLGLIAFKTSEFLTHTETMAIGAGVAISAMFTSATQDAIRFQQQVANVKAIGGESVDAQQIGNAAMEYSNKFGMATASMTEGLEALARAGITTTSVMKGVLEEGVKLSKLEGMDLEDSINDLISTTNLLSTEDVDMNAPEYAEMLKTMNQQIVSTSESAPINAQNIIQSLQHVGGYASASGMDQEDLFAVIAQLGARGTKGEMAGTALRAFIAAGQKDTAQRALARIGLNVTDLWDKDGQTMLSISEMKDVLDNALEERGYSKQEKLEFYSDFAGYKQANQIMKIDTSEVAKYKESIANAWDLGTKLNTILGTVKGNLDRIWQIATNFMTKVGSKLLTLMGAILTPIRIALELFTKIPFADTAVSVGMLFVGFRTGLMLFNKLVPALGGFMSGLKNVKKESFSFNQIWKDTKKEMTLTKEIFDNITDQQSLTKIHLRERGLSANDKFDVETQIAAQMYMGSEEYEETGLEWKELPKAVQNALVAQFKTTDAFDENYKLYLEKTNKFVNNATKDPIRIEKFKNKDKLTSINNYVKYIFELFKDKFEKDDRTKQGKGGNAGIGSSGSGSGSSSGSGSGSTSGSSSSNGGSRGSVTIKSPDERIEEYKKIGQRIQSQASDYGDYLWESSIPELRNPVESFDVQSLIDTRDKIIEDINKKMDNYSTFSPNDLNNMGIERLKKSLTRDAMTDFGIAFSTYSNTSDIRQILSTRQYRKGSSKISSAQINAIAEELGLDITAPKQLDEEGRENLMLTLAHRYKAKYGDDQSVLNNISNRTQKIWHDEQINKKDVSLFPTNTLMKHSDTANQIQSLLGVESIKGIQDYFKNNKNDADYNDNLNKTVKIMSENSDLVDDLVNAEIKYMYENLVRVQNSINNIKKQSHANIPKGDRVFGHGMHDTERGMVYDAAVYLMKAQNKRVIEPKDFFGLIRSVNGDVAANNVEAFLRRNVHRDDFIKKNGKFKLRALRDAMVKSSERLLETHNGSKEYGLEQMVSPRQVFDLMQKNPEISNELTEILGQYIDIRLGEKPTQEYFENKGWMDDMFIPIPYEYTWLLGDDIANGLMDHLSGNNEYKHGHRPITLNNALKIWDKLGPEAILNSNFPYLYDDDLKPTVDNSFERMMLGLTYITLDDRLGDKDSLGERSYRAGIHLNKDNTRYYGVEQTLNTLIHEFTHMALQQDYRQSVPRTDPLFLPMFSDPEAARYNYRPNYPFLADEFETNWVASQVFKSTGIEQIPMVQDRVKGFYHLTDKNGYADNLQWELYDEWIKVISENIDKFIDIGEAFDKKYSSLNPEEISQKWDTLRNQINNTQSVVNDEASHKRQEEIANLRKQIASQEALWAKQGKQYAQERVKQQRELREKQQKVYQEERKRIEEQQKQQAKQYEQLRKDEKERLQKKWNIRKKENEPSLLDKTKSLIKTALNGDTYYFAGEEKFYHKQTPFQKKLQEKGLWAADKTASYVNSGFNKLSEFNDKHQDEKQKEQTSKRFSQTKESINSALKSMKHFNEGLERAATIFPPLTVAVNALNIAIAIGEGITKALTVAETLLNPAKTYETLINLPLITSEQALILSRTLETATIWATDAAIAALEVLLSGPVLIAIAAVVAAIMAVKFWENKHAESLKESQKALQESTAKNNVALSQYKDMKKAREAETDSIKKQQKARKEAIALYRLEAARIEKQKAVQENAKLKNDSVWGEYGFRANLQKMGWGESIFAAGIPFLGTIMKSLSGEFESQYENYDGTTKNVRQIKEATLGNLFATSEQKEVASFYDNNQMFLSFIEAYKDPLTELYDKESKLIEQYGSIDAARGTKEFEEAVQEFADATGLNGETAGKMLDWLETENKVDQATAVGEARIGMIMAQRNAKLMQIEYGDEYGGTDFNDIGNAMVMAQFQDMMNTAKTEVWWDLLFAYLDLIATLVNPLAWGDISKKMAAIGVHQETLSQLDEEGNSILSDMYDAYENSERKDYGTGTYTIMDADTPFGAAKEASAMNYADTQQQMLFNETGQTYTEDEYLAIQDQYQKETYGTTGQQDRDKAFAIGEKNREETKKEQNEKKETTLGQLQENGETAHKDALDIIDAIKGQPGIISGIGAGISSLFSEDNPVIKSLTKKSFKDVFAWMRGEEGTYTAKAMNFAKGAKTAYAEDGLKGVYNYGKSSIKSIGNQAINKLGEQGINIRPQAEKGLELFRKGKSGIKSTLSGAKGAYAEGGFRGLYDYGKGAFTEGITNFKNTGIGGKLSNRVALARETNTWAKGGASISRSGFDKAVGLVDNAKVAYADDGLKGLYNYGKGLASQGVERLRGVAPNAMSRAKTALSRGNIKSVGSSILSKGKGVFTDGITNFKNTEIGGKLADRVALARETNTWAKGGASISRSGFDKAVGLVDNAKVAYADDGLKGLANFGKNTAKSGITSIADSAKGVPTAIKGAPSAIKGAISEAGGLKGISANAMGEMKSAFSPKALAGGVDDIAKGLKGGGSLMKGIGRVGGTALMALGPALAFADKASELNPFDGPHYNEDGTEKKALQATGEVLGSTAGAVGGVAGGMIGADVGGAAGAAIGTLLLPGIGTAIGGAVGSIAGGVAGGWLGDTIFQPIGDAIGGTIGWLGDNLLGGIQNVAGTVWDGLTGAAGGVWDMVSNAATGAWDFLTGGEDNNKPVGGLLGWTPIGMGINAAAGIGEWLFGGDEKNDPYKNVEKATGQKMPKGGGQSKNTIIIKNININTEDDPEKIKSAFMNLMIELQEQVNPRQVSRTVGEPPQAQSSNTNENNEGEDGNQNQAEGSDNDSTNPTI